MARKTRAASAASTKSATLALDPTTVTHTLAKAKPATCGDAYGILAASGASNVAEFAAEGCKRLPRHKGEHKSAKPNGLLTLAQRAARKAAVTRAKVVASAEPKGQTVRVGGVTYMVVMRGGKPSLRAPRVTTLPMADGERQVAAPARVTRTRRSVTSSQPSARLA